MGSQATDNLGPGSAIPGSALTVTDGAPCPALVSPLPARSGPDRYHGAVIGQSPRVRRDGATAGGRPMPSECSHNA